MKPLNVKPQLTKIPKSAFLIALCAATDTGRFAINGVQIGRTPDGKTALTATDGRRLMSAKIDTPYPFDEPAILELKSLQRMTKLLKKASDEATLFEFKTVNNHRTAIFLAGGATVPVELLDGIYPKVWQVVPNDDVVPHRIAVNPEYLEELCKVAKALNPDESQWINLEFGDPDKPLRLRSNTAVAVLMPITPKDADGKLNMPTVRSVMVAPPDAEVGRANGKKAKAEPEPVEPTDEQPEPEAQPEPDEAPAEHNEFAGPRAAPPQPAPAKVDVLAAADAVLASL